MTAIIAKTICVWVNRDRSAAMDCTSLEGYIQGEAEGAAVLEQVGVRFLLTRPLSML